MYSTENAIKNLSVEARYNARQTQSKPILEKMKTWLDEAIVKVPPKSLTGNALSYIANNWKYLIRYINDGRLSIDN
ncbi:MAG: IS66 family element, transposase, partial [uncultured bacterium]